MASNLEDTARQLDRHASKLIDARDVVYQVERMPSLPAEARRHMLSEAQSQVNAAIAEIRRIDVAGALLGDEPVTDEDLDVVEEPAVPHGH